MEKIAHRLEELFQQKLGLYRELKQTFEQEQKDITEIDVDGLWKTVACKNRIIRDIQALRATILSFLRDNRIRSTEATFNVKAVISNVPGLDREKSGLKQVCTELTLIKKELGSLAQANRRMVTEHLSVINGVFSTITRIENREQYTPVGNISGKRPSTPLIRAQV